MDISIITTVKNNPLGIYSTIKSVINQINFKNIEYVIVDASTDKHTSLVINNLLKDKHFKNITYIKSHDNNLYKGLNKGIKISRGKYIGTLNSGDIYYDKAVLGKVAKTIKRKPSLNIIFGNIIFFNIFDVVRLWQISKKKLEIDPFMIPHPGCFIKKSILVKNNYYSTKYTISSDLDFFLKAKPDLNFDFCFINQNLVFMRLGGLSTNIEKFPIKIFEDLVILFSHYSIFFLFFYIKKIIVKLPGMFFLKNKNKYYQVLLNRFLELSK